MYKCKFCLYATELQKYLPQIYQKHRRFAVFVLLYLLVSEGYHNLIGNREMESSIFSIPFFLRGTELPVAVARFEERHWTDAGR